MPSPVTVLSTSSVRGVELREIVYHQSIPRHTHDTSGFCLVVHGAYEEHYARRTLECRARSVVFGPAGVAHANVFGADTHCLNIDMPVALFERLGAGAERFRDPFAMQGGALAWIGERVLREMQMQDDGAAQLIVEGLVLEMIGVAARIKDRSTVVSPAIRRVHEVLHAQFREPLSLADLAAASGRHPVYLAAAFRRAYGETIGDCIRRLRIEHASRALMGSDTPLAEVALAAGFANQSHFTRAFKRATGTTPAAYRRGRRER